MNSDEPTHWLYELHSSSNRGSVLLSNPCLLGILQAKVILSVNAHMAAAANNICCYVGINISYLSPFIINWERNKRCCSS